MTTDMKEFPLNEVMETMKIFSDFNLLLKHWYQPTESQSSPSDDYSFLFDSSFINWQKICPQLAAEQKFDEWKCFLESFPDPELGNEQKTIDINKIMEFVRLSKEIKSRILDELFLEVMSAESRLAADGEGG